MREVPQVALRWLCEHRAVSDVVHHPVPAETLSTMAGGGQLDYDPGRAQTGAILLGRAPEQVTLAVTSEGQAWDADDPHRYDQGHYEVVAQSLVAECDTMDPLGVLVWLPIERCFGSWDPDHLDVLMFPGVTWAEIVLDPPLYLNAISDPVPFNDYLDAVPHHPYVLPDGTVHPPAPPSDAVEPPALLDKPEVELHAGAEAMTGASIAEDPLAVVAALEAHGQAVEADRAEVLDTLCRYLRAACPVPVPGAKRPKLSPGAKAAQKAIGRCAPWGPVDLHDTHLHDFRLTGKSFYEQLELASDLDLHGCLFTGRLRFMWVKVHGEARFDGSTAEGEFDAANVDFIGPVTYEGAVFEKRPGVHRFTQDYGRYFRSTTVNRHGVRAEGKLHFGPADETPGVG